jgi:hypothetical protein
LDDADGFNGFPCGMAFNKPGDIAGNTIGTPFKAPVVYIEGAFDQDIRLRVREVNALKVFGNILVKGFLVFFKREDVIGLFSGDLVCNFVLASLGL